MNNLVGKLRKCGEQLADGEQLPKEKTVYWEAADEIEGLREALGWYANRDNYRSNRLDLGLRARAALKQE